ncbi:hypothetical protein CP8484711_0182B, partial [Chlamydia psittaci 84-8471/1]
TLPLHTCVR